MNKDTDKREDLKHTVKRGNAIDTDKGREQRHEHKIERARTHG